MNARFNKSTAAWACCVALFTGLGAPAVARTPAPLTARQARTIVAPLYDALNEPSKKDVAALLAQATNPDYRSCSTNQDCLDRTQLTAQFKIFGTIIPDLHWKVIDIWTSGNRIVVRGEATGTPAQPLFGAPVTGRSFRTISIDMFTVEHGKLSSAFHVENWASAIEQIKAP